MITTHRSRLTVLIQWGLLLIVAIMPFHAFLSVWLGSLTHHEAIIQAWKEALLVVLTVAAAVLVWQDRTRLSRLRQPWIFGACALAALGIIVSLIARPSLTAASFGLKTDLEFLLAGILAVIVTDKAFTLRLTHVILVGAAIVTGYDILQIFVLPANFLTHFGYGPATIIPYQHIAAGTSVLRFPATLGGPNQLGTYLILPLTICTALFIKQRKWWQLALFATSLISLTWTFSRSAWIGAAVAIVITAVASLPTQWRRKATIMSGLIAAAIVLTLPIILARGGQLQYFILHSSVANHDQANLSDAQHATSLHDGLTLILRHPLGHGLGTAGPATFHSGSANIIENYYLQIGFEMGVFATVLFCVIIISLIYALSRHAAASALAVPVSAAIIGISLVALVLPAWVDSTTALITWIAAGGVAGLMPESKRV